MSLNMLAQLGLRVTSGNVFFFDMDGTLVNTDVANFEAYAEAVRRVLGVDIGGGGEGGRFTRESLKVVIPGLSDREFREIVRVKDEIFPMFLPLTRANSLVLQVLEGCSKTNVVVLVTKCCEGRAAAILRFYNVFDVFDYKFYKPDVVEMFFDKYKNALGVLGVRPEDVVVFEDDVCEADAAVAAGIPRGNIVNFAC
ncbi:MAG TPA: HAD family hydrolase [Nitratidesulfovibrio sp.]|nr:HAD family hydrolase [Nitratidesulfovibrio sp.]